jgi:membrane protein implicated in regulation of membrane protease activity
VIDQIFKYTALINTIVAGIFSFLTLYGGFWITGATFAALAVSSILCYRALALLEKELDYE